MTVCVGSSSVVVSAKSCGHVNGMLAVAMVVDIAVNSSVYWPSGSKAVPSWTRLMSSVSKRRGAVLDGSRILRPS